MFISVILAALNFAVLTDTHVSQDDSPAARSLRACIDDINALNRDSDPSNDIAFVIHCGDLTDFGTDSEEALAFSMLSRLECPFHAVPGNHDATWSESGSNTFKHIFGSETFCFEMKGWRFAGCPSGPDVRMSPALISRESLCWIHSLPYHERTIFFNHYPADSEISNFKEFLRAAETIGTQLFIGGHHHINTVKQYGSTPGILCRSSLPNKESRNAQGGKGCGYTVISLSETGAGWTATASERHCPDFESRNLTFAGTSPWMEKEFCHTARTIWSRTGDSNIAAGFACDKKKAYYGTTSGKVRCIRIADAREIWTVRLPGKIFSTPALWQGSSHGKAVLVIGCADGGIYGLHPGNGRTLWKVSASKAVLASPAIMDGIAYIGASDGVFRAIDVESGKIVWERDGIEGHVIAKAFVDREQVVFGSWGRRLYSLDPLSGRIQWTWQHPHGSRMYSPAACRCVKSCSKIFVAVPDRKVWVLEASTGKVLSTVSGAREAIGISPDGRYVFSKSMHSELICIDARSAVQKWRVTTPLGYDIGPTELNVTSYAGNGDATVIVPTDKGNVFAFSASDGSVLWKLSFSEALVNPVSVTWDGKLLMSSMDGRIILADPHR